MEKELGGHDLGEKREGRTLIIMKIGVRTQLYIMNIIHFKFPEINLSKRPPSLMGGKKIPPLWH